MVGGDDAMKLQKTESPRALYHEEIRFWNQKDQSISSLGFYLSGFYVKHHA